MTWWLIIRTPGSLHAWPVWADGQLSDETLINAARVLTGFPPNDDWITDGSGYDVQLTLGEPHPTLLDRATVGTVADLSKMDRAAVQAHADARRGAIRQAQVDAAKAAYNALDESGKAQVRGG